MKPDILTLFPDGARIDETGSLVIGGCNVKRLADKFGTPLYLYDGATLDAAVATYQAALARHYPGEAQLAYAAKAWLCTATARWIADKGIGLDVVSGGELAIALHGGVPAERIHFHGNNKSEDELAQALDAGVGRIVVDHPRELALIGDLAPRPPPAHLAARQPGRGRQNPPPHPHRARQVEVRPVVARRNGPGCRHRLFIPGKCCADRVALPHRQPIARHQIVGRCCGRT